MPAQAGRAAKVGYMACLCPPTEPEGSRWQNDVGLRMREVSHLQRSRTSSAGYIIVDAPSQGVGEVVAHLGPSSLWIVLEKQSGSHGPVTEQVNAGEIARDNIGCVRRWTTLGRGALVTIAPEITAANRVRFRPGWQRREKRQPKPFRVVRCNPHHCPGKRAGRNRVAPRRPNCVGPGCSRVIEVVLPGR